MGAETAKCLPVFVLPGGDLICTATTPQTISNTLSLSGIIYVNSTVCTSITNPFQCSPNYPINYSGTLNTKAITYAPNKCSIVLTSPNSNLQHNFKYLINATVKMNGLPIAGATVNFSSPSNHISITPSYVNTASNGNATTFILSNAVTSTTVNAFFYNCANTISLTFS